MNTKYLTFVITILILGVAFSAQAHDPKEHMKDAEKPDCAAMKDMDHSKMDMNDPVMQAMMKKCMKDMKNMQQNDGQEISEPDHDDHKEQTDDQENAEDQHSEHQH